MPWVIITIAGQPDFPCPHTWKVDLEWRFARSFKSFGELYVVMQQSYTLCVSTWRGVEFVISKMDLIGCRTVQWFVTRFKLTGI